VTLRDRLIAQIRAGGPLTVSQYMTACLHDPADGYYAVRPALGAEGDFITAPMVSQMFGELIGLWLAAAWLEMGSPSPVRLVEMGPGTGVLMSDILRAAERVPEFRRAVDLWLVETSEPLRAEQRERLGDTPRWAASLDEVPGGAPLMLAANELLDCLPVRQFIRLAGGWAERLVDVSPDGDLVFALAPSAASATLPDAPQGVLLEVSAAQVALGAELGGRVARDGGLALLIDYGRAEPGYGDTLQALRGHRKEHPLASPGLADLTAHADFPALQEAARRQGAVSPPVLTQGDFLVRLGIGARAEALANARPDRAATIERQLERLVSPDQMGELFKVACIHSPGLRPPAFDEPHD